MRTELAITWRHWAGALGCAAALHGMAATLWIGGWDSSAGFGLPGASHVRGPLRIALVGRSASEVAHQRVP